MADIERGESGIRIETPELPNVVMVAKTGQETFFRRGYGEPSLGGFFLPDPELVSLDPGAREEPKD